MVDRIKSSHSHETGKLSHLELVIMLTTASEELGIEKAEFKEDQHKIFVHAMQQAYDHGKDAHEKQLRLSLRNVLSLARQMKKRPVEDAEDHLIRFCAEAGIVPLVLREAPSGPQSQASRGVQDHSEPDEPAGQRAREPTSRPVGGASE